MIEDVRTLLVCCVLCQHFAVGVGRYERNCPEAYCSRLGNGERLPLDSNCKHFNP